MRGIFHRWQINCKLQKGMREERWGIYTYINKLFIRSLRLENVPMEKTIIFSTNFVQKSQIKENFCH